MISEILQHFNTGQLDEALEMANQAVAQNPRDLNLRLVLVQLVCFTGNWERVEKIVKQLEVLDSANEHLALTNFINQMSIAEIQRRAVWQDGMVPEFVEAPDEFCQKMLWGWNCARNGSHDEFKSSVEWVLENAPTVTLEMNDQQHEGFRDLDDRTCTFFEANTLHGIYLWIPHASVTSIAINRPTRLVDYLWSGARINLTSGTNLAVYIPGTYFHSFDEGIEPNFRLGRETRWIDRDGEEIGQGRRIFAAGEDEFTLFDFEDARLNADQTAAEDH